MKDDQQELFVVVDKDDRIVGYRSRYDCHHDKSLIHRGIHVAIFNGAGEILLQKRSQQKDLYPGFYTISVSGHVNKGEEYLDTAVREMQEELCITDVKLDFVGKNLMVKEFETEMIALFKGIHNGPFHFPADEVESVQFYPVNSVKKIDNLTPAAEASLKMLKIL